MFIMYHSDLSCVYIIYFAYLTGISPILKWKPSRLSTAKQPKAELIQPLWVSLSYENWIVSKLNTHSSLWGKKANASTGQGRAPAHIPAWQLSIAERDYPQMAVRHMTLILCWHHRPSPALSPRLPELVAMAVPGGSRGGRKGTEDPPPQPEPSHLGSAQCRWPCSEGFSSIAWFCSPRPS